MFCLEKLGLFLSSVKDDHNVSHKKLVNQIQYAFFTQQLLKLSLPFRCFGLLLAQGRDVSEEDFHLLQHVCLLSIFYAG